MSKVHDSDFDQHTGVAMPLEELHGRSVWNEHGDRLGVVREIRTDGDGRLESFVVRERWMLGHDKIASAGGMRLDGGDIVLPGRTEAIDEHAAADELASPASGDTFTTIEAPVLLAGREGARRRFGGLDLIGSLFGALVAFAALVLVGGILGAAFDVTDVRFDTSLSTSGEVFAQALIIGAITIFIACVIGGWAAGRSSRFDGAANGLFMCVWLLGLGLVSAALGALIGDSYNVYASTNLPRFENDQYALAGVLGVLGALAIMVIGGALGGWIGARWHRRVDTVMLGVVGGPQSATTGGPLGGPVAPQPFDDELDVVEGHEVDH